MLLKAELLAELDQLIADGEKLNGTYRTGEWGHTESPVSEVDFQAFAISARASLVRIGGRESEYFKSLPSAFPVELAFLGTGASVIPVIIGALVALRKAVEAGWLVSLEARLRANVYDDLLVQANELIKAGYHVAAMVLTGSVLEDHLRKLCNSNRLTWTGNGSISKYNDLLRDKAYPQVTWRRVQGIGDLRNEAAHGNTTTVKPDDVVDAHKYVSRFLADHPA